MLTLWILNFTQCDYCCTISRLYRNMYFHSKLYYLLTSSCLAESVNDKLAICHNGQNGALLYLNVCVCVCVCVDCLCFIRSMSQKVCIHRSSFSWSMSSQVCCYQSFSFHASSCCDLFGVYLPYFFDSIIQMVQF